MVLTVRFIGSFRGTSGKSTVTVSLKDSVPLKEAIGKISRELPRLKRGLINMKLENYRSNVLILVNGREVSVLDGLETMVKDGDEVVFVPILHGG